MTLQKFDVFREIECIRNTSYKEKRQIYIFFAKLEGRCLFHLKPIQRLSKQFQIA